MHNQTHYFRLKVVSPLHIGCDEVYEPTSFVIDEQQQELINFDPFDFLKKLDDGERQKFSSICQKGTITSLLEIYQFIRRHASLAAGEKVAVSPSLVQHYQNTLALPANEKKIQQELNNFLISRTTFSPMTNLPYVPGSAIKGSIRTAVLNLRNQGRSQPAFTGKSAARELQENLLSFQFNKLETDPFRMVKVSDFMPVTKAKRRVAYAVDCKKRPSVRDAQALHQILETVEPGAEFIGTITIANPDAKAGIKRPVDMAEVRNAIRTFYGAEKNREEQELQAIGVGKSAVSISNAGALIRLGRHSGAECVTVLGRRKIKIMQGKGNPPKEKDHATTVWLAAVAKKPTNPKSLWPFGWVLLEEISPRQWQELQYQGDDLTTERFDQLRERAEQEEQERELLRVRLKEEQGAREAAEEKRRRQEEEDKLFPWRKKILPSILSTTDWGQLKQHALDNDAAKQHQNQPEVAKAVKTVAEQIRSTNPKKWTAERDEAVAKWLDGTGVTWQAIDAKPIAQTVTLSADEQAAVERIAALKDWGAWKIAMISLQSLPAPALGTLKEKCKAWGCDDKKAKDDKKKIGRASCRERV